MTQTQQHCSTLDHLLTFLRGQLSFQQESELQLHLNDCVLCRERLENAAADAAAWIEARQVFGKGALHESTDDSTGGYGEATQGAQRIRQVLDTLAPTDDPESLGRIGGYEVTAVVGAGGMGVVLKAHDRSLDRIVAIKMMSPHLASSGSARKRFAREAKAAAAVLHPNVISIHSVASEDANPFLVMPYVRGASLQKRIDSQGPLPLKDTLRIGAQIAAGLAAAHEQGLVHRDIKPANILLEEGVERVTITDFGLARAVDDASMTCSGVIAGTPQYMSPEQTRGEPVDARSDLFSLGSVLYAMCAGRSPFRAETTYGVLHRIASDNPTPVCEVNSDVPEWLGHIIERLMAKRPEDRFDSAAQVAELLEGCLAHVQQPAAIQLPEAVTELAPKGTRRLPIRKFVAAAVGGVTVFFAGILIVLELGKGTLTIQSEIDDVPIRIVQGKDVVEELMVSKSGESVRIAAGNYQVEIDGQIDGLALDNGSVTLQRGGKDVVRILKVAPIASAVGDWPYGRLMKDLQQIKPLGGVPVIPSGQPISGAMVDELSRRLEAAPEGYLDKWVAELERITGDKLNGEMARQACRTYIVNRMSVLFDKRFFRARLISTSEAEAWKQAFETLLGEAIGQTNKAMLDGGPSYAVPLTLICTDALFKLDKDSVDSGQSDIQEKYSTEAAVKYRERLAQLSKHDIATWRSKVDRFGGTKLDAAMNIILLDDYFVDETFQDGDFQATLGGMWPVQSSTIVAKNSTASQTRLEFEAHPLDVIALQIGPTKHNKLLEWTSVSTQMGPMSVTITDEKVQLEDGTRGPGFTFATQDAGDRTSTSYIAITEDGPLPIGKFYLYRYKPTTLLNLKASVEVGEFKYPDGTSAPVSVTARAANDTMVTLPVHVVSTGDTEEQCQNPTNCAEAAVSSKAEGIEAAKRLEKQAQAIANLPRFYLYGNYVSGWLDGMSDEADRSEPNFEKAMTERLKPDTSSSTKITGWDEERFLFGYDKPSLDGANGNTRIVNHYFSHEDSVWQRQKTNKDAPRFTKRDLATVWKMVDARAFFHLRSARLEFPWGNSDGNIKFALVPIEFAEYQVVGDETIDGTKCWVVMSKPRRCKLWFDQNSGRLMQIMNYVMGGIEPSPFHETPEVEKLCGRKFETIEAFREFGKSTDQATFQRLAGLYGSLYFDEMAHPVELTRFGDYREIAPGIWFPHQATDVFVGQSPSDPNKFRFSRGELRVITLETGRSLEETIAAFVSEMPK